MAGLDARLVSLLGDRTAKPMEATLQLRTAGDLLRHYPRRYVRRGELTAFNELEVGEHVTLMAKVEKNESRKIRTDLVKTDVVVTDGQRRLTLTFFSKRGHKAQRELAAGREAFFAGRVETFKGKAQLTNPEYELVDDELGVTIEEFAGALIPIYPATAKVSSLVIQRSVRQLLQMVDVGADPLPPDIREARSLLGLEAALRKIHRPDDWGDITRARERLKWDEAFVLQVTLAQRRLAARAIPGVPRAPRPDGLLARFDTVVPFQLTAGQREIGDLLLRELADVHPMQRLLQGEVGSGKTVVALRAMLAVVDSGGQAALLAPTEVLAQQHDRSLRELLGPLGRAGELDAGEVATRVALLTGSQGAAARRRALDETRSGEAGIVVGTHALLGEGVQFHDLGLVVVDEQHRFGVEQRDALRAKGDQPPHLLVMTATPIPRTVAMTVYGDLEVSTLTELPAGRSPIVTHVAGTQKATDRAWARIREEVAAGRQAFVVCPRIGANLSDDEVEPVDDSGRRPAVAVLELHPVLVDGPLAGLRVEVLHGRMAPDAKEDVMRRFVAGQLDVLVATTVIEVGVDVPNATVMVVMDADRFGVSQLHQLRGRIGRGVHPGLCLLVTEVEQSSSSGERLSAVASTTDGFVLSRVDLEQRREGDVLGANQSGTRSSLKLLRLSTDEEVIRAARDEAVVLVDSDPVLGRHPALAQAVRELVDAERAEYLEKA